MTPYPYLKMQLTVNKTRVSVTFPFAAVIMLMLLLCESETVFISLFSSLLHEGGHLFFMLLFKSCPELICFGAFGIRIERRSNSSLSYKKEALIALGGVVVNVILAFFGIAIYLLCGKPFYLKLTAVNGFIAAFNMLPVSLLDFGRFLECMLSQKENAEKYLRFISLFTAFAVGTGCVLYNIFFGLNVSLIAVSIYIILITTYEGVR